MARLTKGERVLADLKMLARLMRRASAAEIERRRRRDALIVKAAQHGISERAIAEAAGITPAMVTRIKQR